jgi:hypothetical protein
MSEQPVLSPRDGLRFILVRYDHGAMAPGVWQVAKALQSHLAWAKHVQAARLRDRAKVNPGPLGTGRPSHHAGE